MLRWDRIRAAHLEWTSTETLSRQALTSRASGSDATGIHCNRCPVRWHYPRLACYPGDRRAPAACARCGATPVGNSRPLSELWSAALDRAIATRSSWPVAPRPPADASRLYALWIRSNDVRRQALRTQREASRLGGDFTLITYVARASHLECQGDCDEFDRAEFHAMGMDHRCTRRRDDEAKSRERASPRSASPADQCPSRNARAPTRGMSLSVPATPTTSRCSIQTTSFTIVTVRHGGQPRSPVAGRRSTLTRMCWARATGGAPLSSSRTGRRSYSCHATTLVGCASSGVRYSSSATAFAPPTWG